MPSTTFELTTAAFPAGGAIPSKFTCDGEDTSPDLAWSGTPDGTQALVLVVDDPDAHGFVHWIAYDMTASDSGALPLGISASPEAPPQGTNDFGRIGWGGPCPPSGEHRYRFTLSALAAPLALSGAPNARQLRDALGGATVLGSATLEGTYRRR
jgi:Raf kinase inhibitor-like YbhB/YbcL family protein